MTANRKEVDGIDDKYRYLPTKREMLKDGKCEGCIAHNPGAERFCRSTELPYVRCPLFKRPKKVAGIVKKPAPVHPDQLSLFNTRKGR